MRGARCTGLNCVNTAANAARTIQSSPSNRAWAATLLDLIRMRMTTILLYTPVPNVRFAIEERTEDDGYVATTYDKSLIKMCMDNIDFRHNANGYDTLMFVALHELAHVINEDEGHNAEFWACFAGLLAIAQKLGYWTRPPLTSSKFAFCKSSVDMTRPDPQYDLRQAFGKVLPKGRRLLAPLGTDRMFEVV